MEKLSERLPEVYKNQMKELLGDDYDRYIDALNKDSVRGLRVNKVKTSVQEFLKTSDISKKLTELGFTDDGFILDDEDKIGNTVEHLTGQIYIQEPSSMVPVCASGIEKEEEPLLVLDLCASPGGKTGQIASRVPEGSIIFSNEIIKARAEILQSNVERLGLKNVIILNEEPKNLKIFNGVFDYVFVDAPCSGEGMFRKNPETIAEWSEENVERCFERQKEILEIAQGFVAAGGKLVYSTCTYNKFEDEAVVDWFLENFNFEIQDVKAEIKQVTIPSNIKNGDKEFARKFLPYSGPGEGQFVAVFENKDEIRKTSLYSKKHYRSVSQIGQSENKLVKEFAASSLFEEFSWRDLYRVGGSIFFAPSGFNTDLQTALEDLKFLMVGVKIGTIEKGRFEPSHNMFMALADKFKHKIELSPEELKKYMHGEELTTDIAAKGYGVVTVGGHAVGGVKIVQNRLKNLYPRGLRV